MFAVRPKKESLFCVIRGSTRKMIDSAVPGTFFAALPADAWIPSRADCLQYRNHFFWARDPEERHFLVEDQQPHASAGVTLKAMMPK